MKNLQVLAYPNAMNVDDVAALFELPFSELIFRAQTVHFLPLDSLRFAPLRGAQAEPS